MSSRSSTQITRFRNPRRLWLFKAVGWLILAMSAFVVFINIPIFYNFVLAESQFPYAPATAIAIIRSIIRRFGEIIFFAAALLILWRSRDPKALLIGMFSAALGAAIGGSYIEVARLVDNIALAIVLIVAALSSSLGVLLLYVLPDGEFFPKQGRWLVLLLTLVESARVYLANQNYGTLSYLLFIPLFLVGGLGIWAQARRYRDGSSVYRQQFKWIIFGAVSVFIGIGLTILGNLFLPVEWRILSAGLDEVGGIVLAISMLFAILRYRLYDIDFFINRSLVYGAVFLGLAAIFAAVLMLLQSLLLLFIPEAGSNPAMIAALLFVALLFDPTRRQIQHWIDRRVYHFRFDLNQLHQEVTARDMGGGGMIGKSLGGYQLQALIGRGGMGEVYRGVKDGRVAALKILNVVQAVDEVSRRRFEREAELTQRLRHPNLVHLHGIGEVEGYRYLALEYIDGIGLEQYLEECEHLPLEKTRQILREIGAALQYAHAQGLVHRDIKPGNIMLRKKSDGSHEAVLMDLGLAKIIGESSTVTGVDAIGTIAYMSPEQIQEGRSVDSRSDIYSLAVMAYQMLTGQLPFSGSAGRMLFGHINQPAPDPQSLMPDLPLSVSLTIQRGMAKLPDDRYGDVAAFLAAIE